MSEANKSEAPKKDEDKTKKEVKKEELVRDKQGHRGACVGVCEKVEPRRAQGLLDCACVSLFSAALPLTGPFPLPLHDTDYCLCSLHSYSSRNPTLVAQFQSEEDLKKKEDLELLVTRVKAPEPELVKAALELLRSEIRSSTSSMTAVPKPLKFLRPHRTSLVEAHASMAHGPNRVCYHFPPMECEIRCEMPI